MPSNADKFFVKMEIKNKSGVVPDKEMKLKEKKMEREKKGFLSDKKRSNIIF